MFLLIWAPIEGNIFKSKRSIQERPYVFLRESFSEGKSSQYYFKHLFLLWNIKNKRLITQVWDGDGGRSINFRVAVSTASTYSTTTYSRSTMRIQAMLETLDHTHKVARG